MTTPADRAAIDLEATRIVNSLRILATTVELEAKKWEHTDTMNEIVQLALARDSEGVRAKVAEERVVELERGIAVLTKLNVREYDREPFTIEE